VEIRQTESGQTYVLGYYYLEHDTNFKDTLDLSKACVWDVQNQTDFVVKQGNKTFNFRARSADHRYEWTRVILACIGPTPAGVTKDTGVGYASPICV
jgi:hypothetical protein